MLDLGCGTGSVTLRLLSRLPSARVVALDVDPVLLTIAAANFAGDERVRIAAWWASAARDPLLVAAMDERRAIFPTSYPTGEFSPPAGWHTASLIAAGFSEATVTWRSGHAAVVTALR